MNGQELHILFFKPKFHRLTSSFSEGLIVFLLIDVFLSRFLLQLVGILLEDIVTKQLKVDMNEQQHTFYCQELGTLLMCLIHIFKSGNTWNVAHDTACSGRVVFKFQDCSINALNYWEGICKCWRCYILLHVENLPNTALIHAGHILHIASVFVGQNVSSDFSSLLLTV